MISQPENTARSAAQERALYEKHGWLSYVKRLIVWRWAGKDTLTGQGYDPATPHVHGSQCVDGCSSVLSPSPFNSDGKEFNRLGGSRRSSRRLMAEAVSPPETPRLTLAEAGLRPLENNLAKGLAVAGGSAAIGVILLGGASIAHARHDVSADTGHGSDYSHFAVGAAEVAAGAALLHRMALGRWSPLGPVAIR